MVKVTVACIVKHKGKIVLVQRKNSPFENTWVLPGGHIDEGETAEHAAQREVKEETGLSVQPHFFCLNNEIFPEHNWHAVVLVFFGEGEGECSIDEEEIADIKLYSSQEIDHLSMGFNHKKIIKAIYNE